MRVRVGCEFQFESAHPVTTVMLVGDAADGSHRTIYESRWAEPALPIRDFATPSPTAAGGSTSRGTRARSATTPWSTSTTSRPPPSRALLGPPGGAARRRAGLHPAEPLRRVGPGRRRGLGLFGNYRRPGSAFRRSAIGCTRTSGTTRRPSCRTTARDSRSPRRGCRDFALLVTAFCAPSTFRHDTPSAICRTSRSIRPTRRWTFTPGARLSSPAGGTLSMRGTTCRASDASSSASGGMLRTSR